MEQREAMRGFLSSHISGTFQDDDDIFKLGFVSSLFAMELVAFVESSFELRVENDDLDFSNFNSVDALMTFVDRKRKTKSPEAAGLTFGIGG